MRVLITGAGGQLGLDLLDVFEDAVGLTRADLDVADEPAVRQAVEELAPDLVVNAAAMTDVDGCEADPDRAHVVNALGPWWLARACRDTGAALVQVSTDSVFDGLPPWAHQAGGTAPDGRDGRGYVETDLARPLNAYGRSKLAGEQLVRDTLAAHYIVRTAWLFGARGDNFVRTMLRVGRERGTARVVDDQVGSPTSTRDLAGAIRELAVSGRFGTYHRTNAGRCSRFEQAAAVFELAGLDVDLRATGSTDLDRAARRPAFSVLDNRHAELSGLRRMPAWRDALTRTLDDLGELAPAR